MMASEIVVVSVTAVYLAVGIVLGVREFFDPANHRLNGRNMMFAVMAMILVGPLAYALERLGNLMERRKPW